jgi:hypothetical protein
MQVQQNLCDVINPLVYQSASFKNCFAPDLQASEDKVQQQALSAFSSWIKDSSEEGYDHRETKVIYKRIRQYKFPPYSHPERALDDRRELLTVLFNETMKAASEAERQRIAMLASYPAELSRLSKSIEHIKLCGRALGGFLEIGWFSLSLIDAVAATALGYFVWTAGWMAINAFAEPILMAVVPVVLVNAPPILIAAVTVAYSWKWTILACSLIASQVTKGRYLCLNKWIFTPIKHVVWYGIHAKSQVSVRLRILGYDLSRSLIPNLQKMHLRIIACYHKHLADYHLGSQLVDVRERWMLQIIH